MKIQDVRKTLTRHSSKSYRKRPLSSVTDVAIHHSGTTSGSAEAYANFHVNNLGWPGIGYHYVIEQDGTIKHCNDLDVFSYHVGQANGYTVGVCLTGDFTHQKPTKDQEESLGWLMKVHLPSQLTHWKTTRGHKDFPGTSTVCPGSLNWEKIIADYKLPSVEGPVYRVLVDGKQIFALREKENIIRQLDQHIGSAKEIRLERI